jgi:hypothetical protein
MHVGIDNVEEDGDDDDDGIARAYDQGWWRYRC